MSTFIQGNVAHYIAELDRMTMDQSDLQTRHTKLMAEHKALQARYELLESRAAALVWSIPDKTTLGELQELSREFLALKERERDMAQALAPASSSGV